MAAQPTGSDAAPLVFYDDARARLFEPFALSSPHCEMRVGALLLRERWKYALGNLTTTFIGAPHLSNFSDAGAPGCADEIVRSGSIVINARAAVALTRYEQLADVWKLRGRLAAVRLHRDVPRDAFAQGLISLEALAAEYGAKDGIVAHTEGEWIEEIWDVIRHLSPLMCADIPELAAALSCAALVNRNDVRAPIVHGRHPLWMEAGAVVEPFTYFDTNDGPVLVRKGAVVQAFTRVVGPCYIGREAQVMTDRVSGSSIGDVCKVHGELSASTFVGQSNKGHDGFVGHSIVGRWVNLGAGTITSNLKNTYSPVALWTPDGVRNTGLQFLGTLFGEHVKTGIGVPLTTGCVLGTGANVFESMPPKVVEPFAWGAGAPYESYEVERFLDAAARMMQRRHVELTSAGRQHLRAVHAARWRAAP